MQKISPLRSSIEAFNKFKALRAGKANQAEKTSEAAKAQTNPFGITFKGNMIQMDVFDKSENKVQEAVKSNSSLKEKMENTGKLLASAWAGTINKFSQIKTNAIAFGNKLKENTIAIAKKLQEFGNKEVTFSNPFKYTVGNLQKQPVSELRSLLSSELQGVTNEQ